MKSLIKLIAYSTAMWIFIYIAVTEVTAIIAKSPINTEYRWFYRCLMIVCVWRILSKFGTFLVSMGTPAPASPPDTVDTLIEATETFKTMMDDDIQYYNKAIIMTNKPELLVIYGEEVNKLKHKKELYTKLSSCYQEIIDLDLHTQND